jgi:hypothetical protein
MHSQEAFPAGQLPAAKEIADQETAAEVQLCVPFHVAFAQPGSFTDSCHPIKAPAGTPATWCTACKIWQWTCESW